jgi:4-hydroxyproline epimerase
VRSVFFCIDGHTAGNPVRLVAGGVPFLNGRTMSERRVDFEQRFDWIRRALMFEPRGHDMMSGGFVMPPLDPAHDAAILFIETSGCLPMCGHGTIGMVTFAIEHGLLRPRTPGRLTIEVPAGLIGIDYTLESDKVTSVTIRNVPAYLARSGLQIELPELGRVQLDVAYGGNFYAIIEPQPGYPGIDALGAAGLLRLSPLVRARVREIYEPVHPLDATIRGVSHVMWTDAPRGEGADGRNAVFYGDRAIDRSPCGTGTSARVAQLSARGVLRPGDTFVHESIIGSRFNARVLEALELAGTPAIIPSIEGSAYTTGYNTIWIDERQPFPDGFMVR